jgi:hypothetical protein
MREFFRRFYFLIHRRRLNAELENDMEFHREMAARTGRNNFGNTLRLREQAYEAWGWTWLDRLLFKKTMRAHPCPMTDSLFKAIAGVGSGTADTRPRSTVDR